MTKVMITPSRRNLILNFVIIRAMIFSKSFSYSVRGILFLALKQEDKKYIQAEEIATALGTPRHFMGKILKGLAKDGILRSNKGPSGGFAINENTLGVPLLRLMQTSGGLPDFNKCALHMQECNKKNPCVLHQEVITIRTEMMNMLSGIKIADLLSRGQEQLMRMITASGKSDNEENGFLNPEANNTLVGD